MLGGWSLAPEWRSWRDMFLRAEGSGGLYPAVSMPVGNSYALPLLDAGRAFNDRWHFRFWPGFWRCASSAEWLPHSQTSWPPPRLWQLET